MSADKYASPPVGEHGIPVGPYYYPHFLHRVADALDALNEMKNDDPAREESPMFLQSRPIVIWNEEGVTDDEESEEGLEGWLTLIDQNCWVFVPYAPPTGAAP